MEPVPPNVELQLIAMQHEVFRKYRVEIEFDWLPARFVFTTMIQVNCNGPPNRCADEDPGEIS